ncbi:MAG TPA: ubiquinol-cytochrome c reductase iron-sulfur subunit [Acidobacteriota bacterium]
MKRRRLVNWFLGLSSTALLGSVLYPVWRFVSPPDVPEASTNRVEAGPTNDVELLERGFKILKFGNEPVILLRAGDDDYRAFAATCTHLDCIVEFQSAERRIWCNCHGGEYDLRGEVVSGPPPRGLEPFAVDLVDNGTGQPRTIVVSRT